MNARAACRASLGTERRWVEEFIKSAFINVVAQRNVARDDRRRGCHGRESLREPKPVLPLDVHREERS